MKKSILLVLVLGAVFFAFWWIKGKRDETLPNNVNNSAPSTNSSLPLVGKEASSSEIVVEYPKLGDKITSAITVRGKARGSWYFEASAPVMVMDSTGKILGRGYVTAQGEWMTTEFVPFIGTITFENTSNSQGGAVVFMNDNPSGEESRSKYLAIPVFFR